VIAAKDADDQAVAAVQGASAGLRAQAALNERGITGAQAREVLAPPALPVSKVGDEDASGLAFLVLFVLYGQLLAFAYMLASGVVEEKSTRIVELVLSTIRARELLAGKVLGIGAVGLIQLVTVGVFGLVLAALTGQLEVGGGGVPGALGISIASFLVGYLMYAALFAAAGALAQRQEDLQSSTTPITLILVAAFIASISSLSNPDSGLATVLSIFPLSAPLTMPLRIISGHAELLEVVAALVLALVTTAVLLLVGARIYANAVLRTGMPVRLRAALRRDATRV
jgi:ABC-2 type transport system permease protein